jgi:hypothetical protein
MNWIGWRNGLAIVGSGATATMQDVLITGRPYHW